MSLAIKKNTQKNKLLRNREVKRKAGRGKEKMADSRDDSNRWKTRSVSNET